MGGDFHAFETTWPFRRDPHFEEWRRRLERGPSSPVLIREAAANDHDVRRVTNLQLACPPIYVQSSRDNISMITDRRVLLAEIEGLHVGFSVSVRTPEDSPDPLFVQIVAVVPEAHRQGIGLALLTAAAACEPLRDIAFATQDSNAAARSLGQGFARSIGANLQRVALGTYRDRNLGIRRGLGYRAWVIRRPRPESDTELGSLD